MMFTRSLIGLMIGLAVAVVAASVVQSSDATHHLGEEIQADLKPVKQDGAKGGEDTKQEGQRVNDSPLEWKADLALWTGVVFLVLLLVLWKFAWGPIIDGLDKRENGIANQISEAETANRDARQLLAEYQQKLDVAGDEVRQMIQQARNDAERAGAEIVEASRRDAKAEQQKALEEIDQATAEALSELAQRSARLAVGLAGKIVKTELRAADHAELVKQAVDGFTAAGGNGKKGIRD